MSEIIWYLSFSDWLISPSIMFSRSIHTVAKDKISSFLWPNAHSFTHGHLGCFHILEIVNNGAVNMGRLCSFELVFWFSSDIFPEVGLLGQKADSFLIFWGISILHSTIATPVCIPTNSAKSSPSSTSSPALVVCWVIDDGHSDRYEMVSHYGFNLHFPDD